MPVLKAGWSRALRFLSCRMLAVRAVIKVAPAEYRIRILFTSFFVVVDTLSFGL